MAVLAALLASAGPARHRVGGIGRSLIDLPLLERKAALAELGPPHLQLPTLDTDDAEAGERFGAAAIAAGPAG